jgi:DNA-binding phage protein|tara:strand:+ start:104 stop:280 length:177 start_codon:yes stop_codon:yes gene_type:complete
MNNAYVATYLAKALLAEKKERLNTRVNEIAAEKGMSILERAKFRARAIEAMDRGELVI